MDFKRNPNKDALKQNSNSVYKDALKKMTNIEEIPVKFDDVSEYVKSCKHFYDLHKDKSAKQNIQLKEFGTMSKAQIKNARKCIENMVATVLMNYDKNISYKEQSYLSFLTLTLPVKQRHTDKVFRKLLIRLIENLTKTYEVKHYVWRAEPQENGNIHFHVLLDRFVDKDKVNTLWCKQLNKLGYVDFYKQRKNTDKEPPAANILSLKKVKNTVNYLLKYMTKPEKDKRPIMGQIWGAANITKKLEYPKFYETEESFNDINQIIRKKHVKCVLSDDYFSVYSGNIFEIVKKLYKKTWSCIKRHYKFIHSLTVDKIEYFKENPIVRHEKAKEYENATQFTKRISEEQQKVRKLNFIEANKQALKKFKENYLKKYGGFDQNQLQFTTL
ncbi:rolling circle replication-associated protein [Tenacibaculum holothuriorum]|uniref:rolling circle replication-associated protein n=1 Tax=Tenacibaculum holothuriorum TaxID=1635173 RepID=UPI00118066CD|nr:hypothetical protein [Tenacibaculum holothuriorum]